MGGSSSIIHCSDGWSEAKEGEPRRLLREVDGRPRCAQCEQLVKARRARCGCDRCYALKVDTLPAMVDDHVCSVFIHGAPKKVAGRLFNQSAWDAAKNANGAVSRAQLLDPTGLNKASVLGEVLKFGAAEALGPDPDGAPPPDFYDPAFFADLEFMERCVDIDPGSVPFAAEGLVRRDPAFVRAACEVDGLGVLQAADPALQADRDTVLAAVTENGHALEHASAALRDDLEVVRTAVASAGTALEFAGPNARRDKGVVMVAVAHAGSGGMGGGGGDGPLGAVLEHAPLALRGDRDVLSAAVTQYGGHALGCGFSSLQSDRAAVLSALRRNGDALKHASQALRNDKAVVLAAVRASGPALRYASRRLRADSEVVEAATDQASWAAIYAATPQLRSKPPSSLEKGR